MSLGFAAGVIAGSVAFMVALMLLVRARLAPPGGHFASHDRAAAVFGFVGAGFAILLGFVVLLAFERYADAKSSATDEATAVFEQYQVAALFHPRAKRDRLWGELVCYGRSVIETEWPAMARGRSSVIVDTWVERMETEVPTAAIATRADETAFQQWFEKAGARDTARRQRIVEARGELPDLLWLMLIIGAVAVAAFTLLFSDPNERMLGQAVTAGSITAIVVASLLAVALLASPFGGGSGRVGPTEMRFTVALIAQEAGLLHDPLAAPCDAGGEPRRV